MQTTAPLTLWIQHPPSTCPCHGSVDFKDYSRSSKKESFKCCDVLFSLQIRLTIWKLTLYFKVRKTGGEVREPESVLTIVSKHVSLWEVQRDKVENQSSCIELCHKAALLKKVSQPESDLTLCSPRQSSKAVSWCTLNSVEFNSRWIPKRSLCITRYEKRGENDSYLFHSLL